MRELWNLVWPWVINLALAAIIFYVGRRLAGWLCDLLARHLMGLGVDEMLVRLVRAAAFAALLVLVALAALDQLGIETTSALAVFGAAGLAIGLAVKDSLSNLAAGVMIAVFRPFQLGHYIEAAGTAGTVQAVELFNTVLLTPDNKRIIVPNRLVYDDTIVNYSAEDTRRVDLVFGIGYEDDIATARQLVESILADDDRVLAEPAATVAVAELADSSVNLNVRPWVKAPDYWGLRSDLLERVKTAFDANGISIPYPQRDVHVHGVERAA